MTTMKVGERKKGSYLCQVGIKIILAKERKKENDNNENRRRGKKKTTSCVTWV